MGAIALGHLPADQPGARHLIFSGRQSCAKALYGDEAIARSSLGCFRTRID